MAGMMETMAATLDRPHIPDDTLPERLAIARLAAGGINATEAATRVGVTGMTWRNWENGVGIAGARKPAMLHFIAAQLGVDVNWLRDGAAPPPPAP